MAVGSNPVKPFFFFFFFFDIHKDKRQYLQSQKVQAKGAKKVKKGDKRERKEDKSDTKEEKGGVKEETFSKAFKQLLSQGHLYVKGETVVYKH